MGKHLFNRWSVKACLGLALGLAVGMAPADALGWPGFSVLDYNVSGIGAAGTEAREALQRIVDYFDPDVIVLQEAKGTTYPQQFLAANPGYGGVYSSGDGAHNRRMIMSKYDMGVPVTHTLSPVQSRCRSPFARLTPFSAFSLCPPRPLR